MRTPAELPEAERAETDPVGLFAPPLGNPSHPYDHPLEVRAHAGRHYVPLVDPGAGHAPLSGATLAGWLGGEPVPGSAAPRLAAFLAASPLCDRYAPRRDPEGLGNARGLGGGAIRRDRVASDGREAAAAAARAFLATETLLVGGQAWIRYRPVLHMSWTGTARFDAALGRTGGEGRGYLPFDPGDLADAMREWGEQAHEGTRQAARALDALRDAGSGEHALLLNLNALPGLAAGALRRLAGEDRAERGVPRPATATHLAACETLDLAGRVGGIGPDAADAARAVLAGAMAYLRRHDLPTRTREAVVRADLYLERFAAPRAAALAAPDPIDALALARLAP